MLFNSISSSWRIVCYHYRRCASSPQVWNTLLKTVAGQEASLEGVAKICEKIVTAPETDEMEDGGPNQNNPAEPQVQETHATDTHPSANTLVAVSRAEWMEAKASQPDLPIWKVEQLTHTTTTHTEVVLKYTPLCKFASKSMICPLSIVHNMFQLMSSLCPVYIQFVSSLCPVFIQKMVLFIQNPQIIPCFLF